ncbi:2,3-bisphosphoglycerate-dependent phosphoglycerate mutase [Polaribacter huanghezhanensis]|uniref:histidine phosphatase family protein n=1 Tax=Polaribacter huanghezhanensis TaxID=1354726 RepID=UPI00264947C5|nr:phosphoglycerate mutase family protein [Polaribacter huanghezhanensis]WKD86711.1 2,3-bisphosphoglycerate-dependent phosphoglycerate mutase [Polaribacter huanghezhanensis]
MKKYVFLIIFAMGTFASFAQEKDDVITTYYLIHHAEKNRAVEGDKDPFLTIKGTARAKHWADVLSTANIDMVYTTNYNRTKETAQPTATQNGLRLYMYDPKNMYDEGFKFNTKGKNVLIVGHSNTTNAFANKILGKKKYDEIADDNNSNLYIVTVTKSGATSVLLKVDN